MDNADLHTLKQASAWSASGHCVVLGTVTRTWGSAPRPVGSLVAIRDDGQVAGSVSGGCIEDDLIDQVRCGTLNRRTPTVTRYGVGREEARRFGLPCNGTLEIVLEPLQAHSAIQALLAALADGQRIQRRLDLASGVVHLDAAGNEDLVQLEGGYLISTHGPGWRLLIIGAGQMTSYLASMAQALDYAVTVCDPRTEYADSWVLPNANLSREMPDDCVLAFHPDAHSAIVALTHDPKLDDLALIDALRSPAFYIGAIGSYANQTKRRQRLREHFGLSETELARLHGPVGIKNGARTPPEIAVSILAELTATRYGYVIPKPYRCLRNSTASPRQCASAIDAESLTS